MTNIPISYLDSEATSLDDNDLLLISKQSTDGNMYTSMKMKGSVLKASGTQCKFNSDTVETACETAITTKTVAQKSDLEGLAKTTDLDSLRNSIVSGMLIDATKPEKFKEIYFASESTQTKTFGPYDYNILLTVCSDNRSNIEYFPLISISVSSDGTTYKKIYSDSMVSSFSFMIKSGTHIKCTVSRQNSSVTTIYICPLG